MRPRFSVLDPQTTFALPAKQTGNGVVDAFSHVIEQYLTFPVNAKVHDRFAEGLLQTLMEDGPKALAQPDDYDARANIMWSATMALNGLLRGGVPNDWASHMIGVELTALYGIDHGETLSVVMPALWQYKREAKHAKLVQYGRRVLGLTGSDEEAIIDQAIAQTRTFFESMGLATRLSELDLDASIIPEVVAQLRAHELVALGEHQDITPDDVEQILKLAL